MSRLSRLNGKSRIFKHISKVFKPAPRATPNSTACAICFECKQQTGHRPICEENEPDDAGKHQTIAGAIFPDAPPEMTGRCYEFPFHLKPLNTQVVSELCFLRIPTHEPVQLPFAFRWRCASEHHEQQHFQSEYGADDAFRYAFQSLG